MFLNEQGYHIQDDLFASDASSMLAEARTLPLCSVHSGYCGDWKEVSAPVIHQALSFFAFQNGIKLSYFQVTHFTQGSIGWHNDILPGAFLGLILYLTPYAFDEETGGYLEFGVSERELVSSEETDGVPVQLLTKVYPKMSRGFFFDAANPLLVHRAVAMKKPLERYSILSLYSRQ